MVFVALAVLNGAFRVAVLIPRIGEYPGHVVSCFSLSALIGFVTWVSIRSVGPATTVDSLLVGGMWLTATLAFEFLAGHYLFGASWEKLLAEYRILQGRLWILVLVATFSSPLWAFLLRRAT